MQDEQEHMEPEEQEDLEPVEKEHMEFEEKEHVEPAEKERMVPANLEQQQMDLPQLEHLPGSSSVQTVGALYLGTEAFHRTAEFATLGVTHRLSCLMSSEEEAGWMDYAGGVEGARQPAISFSTSRDESGVSVARCPMADEDAFSYTDAAVSMLESGAAFVEAALQSGGVVYVHCSQGVSRSPTMVLYYLLRYRGMRLLEAVELVKAKRVKVSPTDGFVALLLRKEEDLLKIASEQDAVISILRRKWLEDFKAGRVKLSHADRIL